MLSAEGVDAGARARVRCLSGDITSPRLGLSPVVYAQLAQRTAAVRHCAGGIARERLFQTTSRARRFADVTPRRSRLVHLCATVVAGRRRGGSVLEDELTDFFGFETHYDESKYWAEVMIRDWARRERRSAVVLRPSVVASDAPHRIDAPSHPLRVLGELIDAVGQHRAPGIPTSKALLTRDGGLRLRPRVSGNSLFNIVPDDYAIEAMLRIGQDAQTGEHGVWAFPLGPSARDRDPADRRSCRGPVPGPHRHLSGRPSRPDGGGAVRHHAHARLPQVLPSHTNVRPYGHAREHTGARGSTPSNLAYLSRAIGMTQTSARFCGWSPESPPGLAGDRRRPVSGDPVPVLRPRFNPSKPEYRSSGVLLVAVAAIVTPTCHRRRRRFL
ncbi:SDR family oxidoreductase [Streptomyces sp. NPDC000070]|uniref:SDR family oxidoreductase n=1 Tax=Streptomyces sp. NPDC000070 TaxID=3154240 RepID=UPI003327C79E